MHLHSRHCPQLHGEEEGGTPSWHGKKLQSRNLGNYTVTYKDCEVTINLRPLMYLSNNNGFQAITPSLFLQPTTNSEVIGMDHIDSAILNKRLPYLQKLRGLEKDLEKSISHACA